MRIAVLMTGLTSYQDVCFGRLAEQGNNILLVHPGSMGHAPFDTSNFTGSVQRHVWQRTSSSSDGSSTSGIPPASTLIRLIDEFNPDVVIMWSWSGAGYRAVMKHVRGRALRVIFSSNFWRGTPKQYVGLRAGRWYVLPLFDVAWVPSERAELFARQIGFSGRQIIRGANSADTATFDRGPRELNEIASRRQFLFTGRLIWHKAPDLLADAYRRYRTQVSEPWDLVIAGEGPDRSVFEGMKGVDLRGFVQPADLAELMHRSSAFVLPSRVEWYGVAIHEAAAAGLPIITTDGVGAVPHFVQDAFNGWAIAANDINELSEAMVRMSQAEADRLKAMSDGSRALATRLTPEVWARNLYDELTRRLVRDCR